MPSPQPKPPQQVAFWRTNKLENTSRRALSRTPLTLSDATSITSFPESPTLPKSDASDDSSSSWINKLTKPNSISLGARLKERGEREKEKRGKMWEGRGGVDTTELKE